VPSVCGQPRDATSRAAARSAAVRADAASIAAESGPVFDQPPTEVRKRFDISSRPRPRSHLRRCRTGAGSRTRTPVARDRLETWAAATRTRSRPVSRLALHDILQVRRRTPSGTTSGSTPTIRSAQASSPAQPLSASATSSSARLPFVEDAPSPIATVDAAGRVPLAESHRSHWSGSGKDTR
jgi:hypothetical protein